MQDGKWACALRLCGFEIYGMGGMSGRLCLPHVVDDATW